MAPVVNIAVCGDFSQLQLVPHLNRLIDLGRVYYAARVSTNARALGLADDQACNAFLKEYLVQFHARYLHHLKASLFFPLYDGLWRAQVLRRWRPCDVLYAVVQGQVLEVLQRAKSDGAKILGHPVMCHPSFFEQQYAIEIERLSLAATPAPLRAKSWRAEIDLCDRLVCLSGLVRDTHVAAGFPADRIEVVPPPIDIALFSPSPDPPPEKPFRVLCVGGIWPIKGHVYLLEAWKKLALPNAELVFAGTLMGTMKPVLARYAGLFRYLAPLAKPALAQLYRECALSVLPSVQDGFGLVVAESLACGTPAIVSDHVGARDIVRPGENGFVVPARDVDALAEAILKVYRSAELRRHLRAGALASRPRFATIPDTAARLAALCARLAGERERC